MREQLLSRMIRIYGFKHFIVIDFARMKENPYIPFFVLENYVKMHEECPIIFDDEE